MTSSPLRQGEGGVARFRSLVAFFLPADVSDGLRGWHVSVPAILTGWWCFIKW